MLLHMYGKENGRQYLAQQKPDFQFNRLDVDGGRHLFGRKWSKHDRYLVGPKEWTQVGPYLMVSWESE
jgi:hypothetical protein